MLLGTAVSQPTKYQEFSNVFKKMKTHFPSPGMRLQDGLTVWGQDFIQANIPMSEAELATLKDYVLKNLEKGLVRHSHPQPGPLSFLWDGGGKDSSLKLCMYYPGVAGL